METKAAKIISYLFHPVFMPLYGLLLLFSFKNIFAQQLLFQAKLMILSFVFLSTVAFPMLVIYMMKKQGFIKSITMDNRSERIIPYMVVAIFYFMTYHMFRQLELPFIYSLFMMGSAFLIALVTLISFRWKISTHMVGIGGIAGVLIGLSFNLSINLISIIGSVILLSGIIGFARLKLNAHKPSEVYSGFLMGVLIMSVLFFIF
jgi:hypothetical protein